MAEYFQSFPYYQYIMWSRGPKYGEEILLMKEINLVVYY